MIKTLYARFKQGYRTMAFPPKENILPSRFLGRPVISETASLEDLAACQASCPTQAIDIQNGRLTLDMGKCLFCGECQSACSGRAVTFTRDYRLSETRRSELVLSRECRAAERKLRTDIRHIFGRSLKLRQVSAGGCNACEADINVLNTPGFDLGRFGIQFVASPRHADGIVLTGPVTKNMALALEKTYQAIPSPKLVIAVGACAISGGPYIHYPQVFNGMIPTIPVDLYIPGCPPHPLTILDGLLGLMGKLKEQSSLKT